VLEEVGDVHARRQLDEPLPEAEEQVVDLGGLRLGLLLRDFPEAEGQLLALESEEKTVTAAPFLKSGYRCGSNATPALLPICYQVTPGRKNKGSRLSTQPLTLHSAEERT